jgi:hypothetical protein
MKRRYFVAIAVALIVYIVLHLVFFVLSFISPSDYLMLVLSTLLVPIALGITGAELLRQVEVSDDSGFIGWVAGLGMLGGYIGSLLISGILSLPPPESFLIRMVMVNFLQIITGLLVQGIVVFMSRIWKRNDR